MTRRTTVVLAGLLLGLLSLAVLPASPAQAHAVLSATTPAQGSVVQSVPDAVSLTFSEPVGVLPGKIQVFAPDGKRIHAGDPVAEGGRLVVPLRTPDRPLGSYVVSFRI